MYIGYLNDREELKFRSINDINAAKRIVNLKKFLKKTKRGSVSYLIKKGKQVCILIFSKEVLVAVFSFFEPIEIQINVHPPLCISSEVYKFCVIKSNNLRFLNSLGQISDFILKLKRGSDELTNEEQEKFAKNILAKFIISLVYEVHISICNTLRSHATYTIEHYFLIYTYKKYYVTEN